MNDQSDICLPVEHKNFANLSVAVERYKSTNISPSLRRVCFITQELPGLFRNGGAGTAMSAFATSLSAAGHEVTILYAATVDMADPQVLRSCAAVRNLGIKLFFVQDDEQFADWNRYHVYRSFAIYQWLKKREFDIVHFNDFEGYGFYSSQARRCGTAFQNTLICVFVHGATRWGLECMEEFLESEFVLLLEFMERRAIELADLVIAPSKYMLNWMKNNNFNLPREAYQQQLIFQTTSQSKSGVHPSPGPVNEIVFFGRQELRKGLKIFIDAVRQIGPRRPDLKITFLGKYCRIYEEHTGGYAVFMLKDVPNELSFYANYDRDAALSYLKRPGVLAVIPSADDNFPNTVAECVVEGINFIAADSGGIPEILDDETRQSRLFPYSVGALVQKLEESIEAQYPPAYLAYDIKKAEATFIDWHAFVPCLDPLETDIAADPLVTVCIIHYNRPRMLRRALASIDAQSYRNIEIIVVDDGSTLPEARAEIDQLRARTEPRPILVVDTPDIGLGPARNAGAKFATGEYLCFVDDDNIARPKMIETFVRAMRTSGADIATCFAITFDDDDIPTEDEHKDVVAYEYLPVGSAVALGFFRNAFGDANGIIRRSVFETLTGFAETRAPAEDWEFYARAALAGYQINVIPEPLFWYCIHPARLTARPYSRWQTYTQIANLYIKNIFSDKPHPEVKWVMRCAQAIGILGDVRGGLRGALKARDNGLIYEKLLDSNPEDTKRLMAELFAAVGRISDSMRMHAQRADYHMEFTAREQLSALNTEIRALRNQVIDTEAALAKQRREQRINEIFKARNGSFWTRLLTATKDDVDRDRMNPETVELELMNSGLFDADWYLRKYPDVAGSGRSPANHYLENGYLRGYCPNLLFHTRWYLENYPDVLQAGHNPLLHYLYYGHKEGRNAGPGFQTSFYLDTNPDVRDSGMNALVHYLRYGRHEGRLPVPSA